MKKIACLCLVLVNLFLLCLTGCSKTENTEEKATPASNFEYKIDDEIVLINEYLKNDDKVIIPDKIDNLPVTIINMISFMNKAMKSVTIPDTVTHIRDSAFMNCQKLTKINFGDGVTEIGMEAFRGCISLKNITLPESLEVIGTSAFKGCSNLKKVTIPENVSEIGMEAFLSCNSLEEVIISGSNAKIRDHAFFVSGLRSVVFLSDAPEIGDYAFWWDNKDLTFYYKKGTKGWDDPIFDKCNLVEYS